MTFASGGLPAPTIEDAPAKINLALHVTGRRADGYHLLDTVAVFTQAGDRVTLTPSATDGFSVSGPFAPSLPVDGANLVLRARDAFFARFGSPAPLSIVLEKNLPVSSGIGGGSSDAAAALRALQALFRSAAPVDDLLPLALPLGADVPMCLVARPLRASGIGERIDLVPQVPALPLLLVNPGLAVSTPAIFQALRVKENPPCPPFPARPDIGAVRAWLGRTRNDLQAPAAALAPPIDRALQALLREGAAFARMSGSGATCFGLFASAAEAQEAAAVIRRAEPAWWVCPTGTIPS